jgi:hypothetical protein
MLFSSDPEVAAAVIAAASAFSFSLSIANPTAFTGHLSWTRGGVAGEPENPRVEPGNAVKDAAPFEVDGNGVEMTGGVGESDGAGVDVGARANAG